MPEEYKKYQELVFDLGVERKDEELEISGDFILVEYLDGEAYIKLDNPGHDPIDLSVVKQIKTSPQKFNKIYITNSAQSGKTLKLLIGGAASFTAVSSESIGLYFDDEYTKCAKVIAGSEYKDFIVMDNVSVDAGAVVTHTGIDISKFRTVTVLISTTGNCAVYIQFSDDNSNWYDLCDAAGTPYEYTVNNEKKAIGINDFAHYMRVVVKNNDSASVTVRCVIEGQI